MDEIPYLNSDGLQAQFYVPANAETVTAWLTTTIRRILRTGQGPQFAYRGEIAFAHPSDRSEDDGAVIEVDAIIFTIRQPGDPLFGTPVKSDDEAKRNALNGGTEIVRAALAYDVLPVGRERTQVSVYLRHPFAYDFHVQVLDAINGAWPDALGLTATSRPVPQATPSTTPISKAERRPNKARRRSASRREQARQLDTEGKTRKEIAGILGVHERTVYHYLQEDETP